MKINELIADFKVYVSNEETDILGKLKETNRLDNFTEREQTIIRNLINKSLVQKIVQDGQVRVVANEYKKSI
tara:strand:- start:6921 stop:7136 length:216 start_codon:yes stop_codon:yes gene_type:complete